MTEISAVLQTQAVSKTYKTLVDEVVVFEDITLSIEAGQAAAIIGESGRGKTTLLNILSGLDRPSSGQVWLCQNRIDNLHESPLSDFRNQHVGFIFQHHYLLDDFTALENILVPVRIRKAGVHSSDVERAMEFLSDIGLADRASHYPDQLSGGERQRVAVIRSLINDPSVIFADEPTGSLDRRNAENVEALMWDLKDRYKKTLVIATHSMEMAAKCDKVIELN